MLGGFWNTIMFFEVKVYFPRPAWVVASKFQILRLNYGRHSAVSETNG